MAVHTITTYSCNAILHHPTYFYNKKCTVKCSVHFIFATLIVQNACSQLRVKSSDTTAALCCLPKKDIKAGIFQLHWEKQQTNLLQNQNLRKTLSSTYFFKHNHKELNFWSQTTVAGIQSLLGCWWHSMEEITLANCDLTTTTDLVQNVLALAFMTPNGELNK
jgi:hypothetical protein